MLNRLLAEDLALRRKQDRERVFRRRMRGWPEKQILVNVGVRDIARGAGFTPARISRIFNELGSSPRLEELAQIAAYLTAVKGRVISVHDVIDIIQVKPWRAPLNHGDVE